MNKTNFQMKSFALGLALKQRQQTTQKWAITLLQLTLLILFFNSFCVNDHLYYGTDRLHLVERALGNTMALPLRLVYPPPRPSKAKLTIYHDFASPWSYVGARQVTPGPFIFYS